MMMEALDFRNIPIAGPVGDELDRPFLEFACFLNSGTLDIPASPRGDPEKHLLDQWHKFKTLYKDNFRRCTTDGFPNCWHKRDSNKQQFLDHQAILETFLDPAENLHNGIPDIMEVFEIVAVSSRSQSDTERTVKLVKEVMRDRYQGKHDEQKEDQSGEKSHDRVNEETFIAQNGHPNLKDFPSDLVYTQWMRYHKSSQMSTKDGPSKTLTKLGERPKRHQFW